MLQLVDNGEAGDPLDSCIGGEVHYVFYLMVGCLGSPTAMRCCRKERCWWCWRGEGCSSVCIPVNDYKMLIY